MNNIFKRRYTLVCLLFFLFTSTVSFSRHINLDKIYIEKSSSIYKDLQSLKKDAYKMSNAIEVDSNIIFAGWTSGNRLVYIKEYPNTNRNAIYEYYPAPNKRKLLHTVTGAIIYNRLSLNGHYLILKTLKFYSNETFKNEILIFNLRKNKLHRKSSSTVFTDFTVSYFGDLVYYETPNGIVRYNPDTDKEQLYIPKSIYSHYFSPNNITLAFISPYEDKILLLNGGGGSYRARLLYKGKSNPVKGITSASEVFWINNNNFIYRTGYIGNYRIKLYNAIKKTSVFLKGKSYNTNITISPYDNYITFLQDGMVSFYYRQTHYLKLLPIEGEDVFFSPSGNTFCALFDGDLFVAKYSNVLAKRIELRRNAEKILNKYENILKTHNAIANQYSFDYIKRKINIYKKLLK